jgi:transcriptional regulator GlxA family with amidase domain
MKSSKETAENKPANRLSRTIVILAVPPTNELDVVGPFQVFGTVNRLFGQRSAPYKLAVASSVAEESIAGYSGLSILSQSFYRDVSDKIDTLLIAGGTGARYGGEPNVLKWITRMSKKVRRLGSVCTGAFLLAEAGLLDGKRATTHWAFAEEFAARYSRVLIDPDPIWSRDGKIYTSAGVTAGMDLALALIEEDLGGKVALAVARDLVLFLRRPGSQSQFSRSLEAQKLTRKPLQELVVWMVENLNKDLSVENLATHAAMNRRNFTRVFASELGASPARYVEQLRIEAARRLLEESRQSVEEIAYACGFSSGELLRRAFLRSVRTTPSQYRERFRLAPILPPAARIYPRVSNQLKAVSESPVASR